MNGLKVASGWFDDVAAAAVAASGRVVVAVCEDLRVLEELVGWLDSAIPTLAETPVDVCQIAAADVEASYANPARERAAVFVVPDSTQGADQEVSDRWARWNTSREVFLLAAREKPPRRLILLATRVGMHLAATAAPDLLSIAEVLTVTHEPYRADAADREIVEAFRAAAVDLERRYAMTTGEFVRRLLDRDLPEMAQDDQRRWEAIAGALREDEVE